MVVNKVERFLKVRGEGRRRRVGAVLADGKRCGRYGWRIAGWRWERGFVRVKGEGEGCVFVRLE